VLTLWGIQRGRILGVLSVALGTFLLARAATSLDDEQPAEAAREPVTVEQVVELPASIRKVFGFWSSFSNFPRFMGYVREVQEDESGVSHWVAEGPGGAPLCWDAEVTGLEVHRRLAWESVAGSAITCSAEVTFEAIDRGHTRLHVRVTYHPLPVGEDPLERPFFGSDPQQQLADDLERLRVVLGSRSKVAGRAS